MLSVLISTYGSRIENLERMIPGPKEGVVYLIGHQNYEGVYIPRFIYSRLDIFYYPLASLGVTSSRNFLLNKSKTDIIWFCDDDIVLKSDFSDIILKSHINNKNDILIFSIENELGQLRKNNDDQKSRGWFDILSVGTIEISLKRRAVNSKARFPEFMGCGSNIPIGDEAVFLSKLIRNGFKIVNVDKVVAMHPEESSGSIVNPKNIYARGFTLAQVYSNWGLLLLIPFLIFRFRLFFSKDISKLTSLSYYFSGFWNGLKMK